MRLTEKFFGISKIITRSLVGKPATLMHPQVTRVYFEATRGKVENEIEKCIFCRLCEKNCPTAALSVFKEKNEWDIDSMKCCQCRRCVEICPTKCLSMENVYFPAVRTRAGGHVPENPSPWSGSSLSEGKRKGQARKGRSQVRETNHSGVFRRGAERRES